MTLHGQNFQQTKPTITLNSNSSLLGTTPIQVTEFLYKYPNVPSATNPTTVTLTVPSGCVVNYTWGPQHPTMKVDNISCFKYTGPISLTNNRNQDGVVIYAAAFRDDDSDGNADYLDQSAVVTAKFHVTMP